MRITVQSSWTAWLAWRSRQSRVARFSLWLVAVLAGSVLLGRGLGFASGLMTVVVVLCTLMLLPLSLILLYRWISQRVLWKVRNRLILTYLLMGLSPVVLFGTLGGIAAYLLAGQYATTMALFKLVQLSTEEKAEAARKATTNLPREARPSGALFFHPDDASTRLPVSIAIVKNGGWDPPVASKIDGSAEVSPFTTQPLPAWLHPPFRGVVSFEGRLYLCSESIVSQGSRSVVVLGSSPLNGDALNDVTKGLGSVTLRPGFSYMVDDPGGIADDAEKDATQNFAIVSGGVLAPRVRFFDTPVFFGTSVAITSWETGRPVPALMIVTSRPTLLYANLFATSVRVGQALRTEFFGVAVFFVLLELLALLMAAALSRTITRSVADLYRGTKEIDAGHLDHRVRVVHRDQLGALAVSFNTMASSINDLLLQQREKERLLSELAIAQEVQSTLFPHSPASLPGFEIHAVCLPARTVGGDYFDFIFRPDAELCLALGDISGKGISAALLMASLHSAVRAFSLGCMADESTTLSPALLLTQINHHLYRSTQAARYATLFVAWYDVASRKLTYANGGHLSPLILSNDGSLQRLSCGGSVVGLLEKLEYSEATVQLQTGDLLIAFTDGLTEPENESGEYGEQRLISYIRRNRQQPLPLLAENTLRTLQEWIGDREQPDDMTLLLARQL